MAYSRQQADDDKPESDEVHIDFTSSAGIEMFAAYRLASYREGRVHTDRGRAIVSQRKLFAAHGSHDTGVLQAKCLGSNPGDEYAIEVRFISMGGGEVDWADVHCTCPFARTNQVCKHILAVLLLRLDAAAWQAAAKDAAAAEALALPLPSANATATAAASSRAAPGAAQSASAAVGGGGNLPRKRRMPNLAGPPPKAAKKAAAVKPEAKSTKAAASGLTGRPLPAMRMKGGQLLVDSDEELVQQCHAALAAAAAAAVEAKPCKSGPQAPASPASKSPSWQQQQQQPRIQQPRQQQQQQQQQQCMLQQPRHQQHHQQQLQEQEQRAQQPQGQQQQQQGDQVDMVEQPVSAQPQQPVALPVPAEGPSMFEMMFGADFMASIKPEPAPSTVAAQGVTASPLAPAEAHDTPLGTTAPAVLSGMGGGAKPPDIERQGNAVLCCDSGTGHVCDLTTQLLEECEVPAATEGAAAESVMAEGGGAAEATPRSDSQQESGKLSLHARLALGGRR